MSRSFIRSFFAHMKHFFEDKATRDVTLGEVALRVGVTSLFIAGHGIYAYSTEEKEAIIVTKKYKMNRGGYTDFMIIDEKGRHFNVNNSLWYWKWNSIEDWHNIDEKSEEKLLIRYYGWRMPAFGLFPNIIVSDRAKFLNSMSSSEFRRFEAEKLI
jgi:hypothetical protein